jgi:hypothetical protein
LSKKQLKSFADVRAAFESRSVVNASRRELEELLAAAACEKSDDPATRAQVREIGETIRELLANRRNIALRRPSGLAIFATLLAALALLWSGADWYRARSVSDRAFNSQTAASDYAGANISAEASDLRTNVTIAELAKRAPSLRTGTVQAWWAGEQARQVQRLEAQAKRQALAGDRDGAARSVSRADAIRSGIPALAESEKPSLR